MEKQRNISPVNLWFDLEQIATEFIFVGIYAENAAEQHTKNGGKSRWGKG